MLKNVLTLRFCKRTGALYYTHFVQQRTPRDPWAFFALFDFCAFSTSTMHHLCTAPFLKREKRALKHSVQRPNKVLFGQKSTSETVAMTAHFPTLTTKKWHFLAFLVKKLKSVLQSD